MQAGPIGHERYDRQTKPITIGYFQVRKYLLDQNQQVHHEEDRPDPGKRCIGPLSRYGVQSVPVFALTERAFDRNTLPILFPTRGLLFFDCLSVFLRPLFRTTQRLSSKTYSALFQITPVVPTAVYGVRKNHLRIKTIAPFIRFDLAGQVMAFMKGVPAYVIDLCDAFVR